MCHPMVCGQECSVLVLSNGFIQEVEEIPQVRALHRQIQFRLNASEPSCSGPLKKRPLPEVGRIDFGRGLRTMVVA